MRRISLVLAILTATAGAFPAPARADQTGSLMADAARRFLAALDETQRARAEFPLDSPERFNWHWIPRERKGIPFKSLTGEQRALAFGLLNTGLSTRGVVKATTIMSLEEILRVEEQGKGPVRDTELYFVSIFGKPSDTAEWGWRIEGHHLALNYTLAKGKVVSATPFMFGSNPAKVKSGPRKGLRNLAEIENPANKLLLSLNEEQRKLAIVSDAVPDVTTTPNSARVQLSAPEGIAVDKLDADQRKALNQFLHAYAINFPPPIAADLLHQFDENEKTWHFAWFGPADPAKPHSFRVQGQSVLIDFNDKQNEANHIHTFYRNALGDFGLPPEK